MYIRYPERLPRREAYIKIVQYSTYILWNNLRYVVLYDFKLVILILSSNLYFSRIIFKPYTHMWAQQRKRVAYGVDYSFL